MKQRDLLRKLSSMAREHGTTWDLVRNGSDHDQYRLGGMLVPIPRHRDINERTAKGILKDAADYLEGTR